MTFPHLSSPGELLLCLTWLFSKNELCHFHKMPLFESRLSPSSFVFVEHSENGQYDDKIIFSTQGEQEQPISVHFFSMWANYTGLVIANLSRKINEKDHFVIHKVWLHKAVKVLIESLLVLIDSGQSWSIGADNRGMSNLAKKKAKLHQSFTHTSGEVREVFSNSCLDGKMNSMDPVLILFFAFPEDS